MILKIKRTKAQLSLLLFALMLCSCRTKQDDSTKNRAFFKARQPKQVQIAGEISKIFLSSYPEKLRKSFLDSANLKCTHPKFSSKFEQKLKDIYAEKAFLGDFILAIVGENGLIYTFAWSKGINQYQKKTLDNDSPIYVASHTKSFTGTLLKILEQKGTLDLDKSLKEYLPDLTFRDSIDTKDISIKSLLNHSHGIFSTRMTWKTAFLGYSGKNSELINDLNHDFLYDPSRNFRYSNVGPIIAGMVVERTTDHSWKDEMKSNIFLPLKMKNTSANISDFKVDDIRPSLTVSKENKIVETGFYKAEISMHASGGIISTVNDLSKWLSANIRQDEALLTKEAWAELHHSTITQDAEYFTYHRNGYSLGWDVAEYQQEKILTRFGGLAGISFHISFMPGKKIGIIAFSNDNRAYILPHLMANYAYNQINSLPADSIFHSEKIRFDKSFETENSITYPDESQLVAVNRNNDSMLGTYNNTAGWPTIKINKSDGHYILNWGILSGKIYQKEDGGYITNMGVLNRKFELRNDTLKTGTLDYIKARR